MRNATSNTRSPKLPTHVAYLVQDREGKKPFWQKVGAAWSHSDGKGFSLQLDAMPLDGRITLRVNQPKKKT
jgi:hypothetical protein